MRLWLPRFLIAIVLLLNVQCALIFLIAPSWFAPSYELNGEVGEVVVRAFGVLFLMWNVPYIFAAWHPRRHRVSLWQATIMQAIGLIGETGILSSLSSDHLLLRDSIFRFIVFDGAGLVALIVAINLIWDKETSRKAAKTQSF